MESVRIDKRMKTINNTWKLHTLIISLPPGIIASPADLARVKGAFGVPDGLPEQRQDRGGYRNKKYVWLESPVQLPLAAA